MNQIFDTHTHYNDRDFREDQEQLLLRLKEEGIEAFTEIGFDLGSSEKAVDLAKHCGADEKLPHCYAAVGVHPDAATAFQAEKERWSERLRELSREPEVVAIGEVGLDYCHLDRESPACPLEKEAQLLTFREMLELSEELKLPVVIHSRDAARDTLELLREFHERIPGGIIHCYSYSLEVARECIRLGFHIGIGGAYTFKNARRIREVVQGIAAENIVLETDCPYMAPFPVRGTRNDSRNISYIVSMMSREKGMTEEELIAVTRQNANTVYRIPSAKKLQNGSAQENPRHMRKSS